MPAFSALSIGEVNAVADTTVVAMPADFAATAELNEVSMVGTVGWVELAPVHAGVGMPSRAAQSWKPYWVGVKNELSVTWFTNVNFHLGTVGKFPAASLADGEPLLPLALEPHAASRADAAAVALTSPVPWRRRRRVGPSFMLSVWIASSTFRVDFAHRRPPGCSGMSTRFHQLRGRRAKRSGQAAMVLPLGGHPQPFRFLAFPSRRGHSCRLTAGCGLRRAARRLRRRLAVVRAGARLAERPPAPL